MGKIKLTLLILLCFPSCSKTTTYRRDITNESSYSLSQSRKGRPKPPSSSSTSSSSVSSSSSSSASSVQSEIPSTNARIFYIDNNSGSDSNSGTSKTSPWKKAPGMQAFSGNYTHQAGDRFIFKGGVTWGATNFPMNLNYDGAAGLPMYYGADSMWFEGSSWARPLFDGEYKVRTLIDVHSRRFITIDNLELTHVSSSGNESNELDRRYGYGLIAGYAPRDLLIDNSLLHGWRIASGVLDDAHGGVIFGDHAYTSVRDSTGKETGRISHVESVVIDRSEIHNKENMLAEGGPGWNGVAVRKVGVLRRSKVHHNSSGVLFVYDFDRSELYNICFPESGFDGTYHFNGVYLDSAALGKDQGYIRNSKFYNIGGGANMAYPNPRNATQWIYNNLFYGVMSDQLAISIDPYDAWGGTPGVVHVYNNTIVNYKANRTAIHVTDRGGNPRLGTLSIKNNHIIGTHYLGENALLTDGSTPNTVEVLIKSNNLMQDPQVATAQGYVSSNQYAPASSSVSTVQSPGEKLSSFFTLDIRGFLRSTWNIGAYEFQ